ncbi:MAG: FAD:protein FMN transferase [Sedimentisphaerales bacterium]|nr:FAD:protein FMN transferase [Sedimentisphaerales bacterium]
MQTKRLIRIAVFTIIILAVIFFAPKGMVELDSGYKNIMGTFARVLVVAKNQKTAQKAIDAAFDCLERIENLMSVHIARSEVSKINSLADKEPVTVSDDTFAVLEKSIQICRLTDGAFDITIGALIDLWKNAADTNQPPTDDELAKAKSLTGYDKLILNPDDNTVRFSRQGVKIDLGGIAKGYAIDQALETLKNAGALGGLVDLGGNIRCFGTPAGRKEYWLIGLQNPDLKNPDALLMNLKLTDEAVATSGHYHRFYDVQGKRQSHIIDTKTSYGTNKLSSVTIIAKDAITADAFSTAVSVLGKEKGLELIESIADTEAILVSPAPDYEKIFSNNAEKYISDTD